jgi:hypothetical protein
MYELWLQKLRPRSTQKEKRAALVLRLTPAAAPWPKHMRRLPTPPRQLLPLSDALKS